MLKKILYILLCVSAIFYLFIISFKLEKLSIQLQEIGTIIQNMNQKAKNSPKKFQYSPPEEEIYIDLKLQVTAYNSEISQTDSDPNTGAWNNRVRPGMIAVSRDLESIGLTNGVPIIIEKYDHIETIILDKMNTHKTIKGKRIKIEKSLDIWMESEEEAVEWGVKYCNVKIPIEYIDITKFIIEKFKIII